MSNVSSCADLLKVVAPAAILHNLTRQPATAERRPGKPSPYLSHRFSFHFVDRLDLEVIVPCRLGQHRRFTAFTLVELLVVIAIIGVLVALLLPAVQAAREAARRTQCMNQVKQMMLSMHNHESAKKAFPSGGIGPWPEIQNYLTGPGGTPFGPDKQGLSWAYQILPYLEGQAVYNIKTNAELQSTPVTMFNCPSRRPTTKHPIHNTYLMDYAAAVPSRTSNQRPATPNWLTLNQAWGVLGCQQSGDGEFWGTTNGSYRFESDMGSTNITGLPIYVGYMGVIVRSDYCATCTPKRRIGFYSRISFEDITDGSSNTFVLGEKRMQPSLSDLGDWYDDKGWADGWDPDTLRCTFCPVGSDQDMGNSTPQRSALPYSFGAAHSQIFNAGFADAHVQSIRFDIDVELFNRLGHRSDGEEMDMGAL
jgi:prepilin-type N-terminal cleavage/methylation domain-containing protein